MGLREETKEERDAAEQREVSSSLSRRNAMGNLPLPPNERVLWQQEINGGRERAVTHQQVIWRDQDGSLKSV
jgi:hypothetical protein